MKQTPVPSIDLAGTANSICDEIHRQRAKAETTPWTTRSPKMWIAIATTILTVVFSGGVAYNRFESSGERLEDSEERLQASEATTAGVAADQKISNVKLEALQDSQKEMAKDVKEIQRDVNQIQQDIAAIKEAVKH